MADSPVPRILFFTTSIFWEGGASRAFCETIRRVSARGIDALVVVPDCQDSRDMFPESEFNVVFLKLQRPRRSWNPWIQGKYFVSFPATLYSLCRLIRKRSVDLVHFNELMDFVAGIAAKACRVPCVCHVRAHRLPNPHRWLMIRMLTAFADSIVVPSQYTARWIKAESAELGKRVRLIYDYAWNDKGIDPLASGEQFRRECGLSDKNVLVLLVSKLTPSKGHECFIRAAEKVRKVNGLVRFVIVGGPIPGRKREARVLQALGERLVPSPVLRFLGPRLDLDSVYAGADIVVHCPIFPDTFPTVVLLPMFAGKPVIGTKIGGIPEQIEHDRTGLLVPPNDAQALAEAILELSRDPGKGKAIGLAAQEMIRRTWAPENQATLLAELYAEVIQRQHSGSCLEIPLEVKSRSSVTSDSQGN
jgi:glycosyltransferase involved in cell wall biosynthesis